jgi:hypothetical protein
MVSHRLDAKQINRLGIRPVPLILDQFDGFVGTARANEYTPLILLRHEFLRRDGPAIGALQQGHRDRILTRAPISRRRMVAIEFGM